MKCPHCAATTTRKRAKKTAWSYATFFCSICRHTFNERTGSSFHYLEAPTDIVLLVVLWRLRYKLSLRDIAEMFLERGFVFTHEAVRDWEARLAPFISHQLRSKRRGRAGLSWYVDEAYIRIKGKWCNLYSAIDADGNLVVSRLSEKRYMEAAQQFFKQALGVCGHAPEQVTTDGHASHPRAVREIMGEMVQHRTNKYLNNILEQNHRGVKQRDYPMCGFGNFESAARFCRAFDELRHSFRLRSTMGETRSLAEQRRLFCERLTALQFLVQVAS